MRLGIPVLSVVLFLAILSYPQNNVEVENDLAHHVFYVDFAPRGQLDLRIRPAEIHIIGSDQDRIVVRVGGRRGLDSRDVQARFDRRGNSGVLEISGGPHNEVSVSVQVGEAASYSSVKASVTSGEINAKPFSESHGGLFRSLEKHGNGKYKLRAYVGAGRLTLN
jgi:hypothetical protein